MLHYTPLRYPGGKRQRAVYVNQESADIGDLGFAAFFLNRTNRSGILNGGVIGGKQQAGEWRLGVRFNKPELIRRIRMIGRYRSRIKLTQLDALEFSNQLVRVLGPNSFIFYDPPYIEKGEGLYLNEYDIAGHREVEAHVVRQRLPWVVVYDYAAVKYKLYKSHRRLVYWLHYISQDRYQGREVMYLSNRFQLPAMSVLFGPKMHAVPNLSRLKLSG
jgi:DNA adenine methylase